MEISSLGSGCTYAMSPESTKLRQVLISRGRVVARREQLVGSVRLHKTLFIDSTIPRELDVSWVVISLGSSDTQEQYAGIRLHIAQSIIGDFAEQECYLDLDEVQEFLNGIDVVNSFRGDLEGSLSETRDVFYASKEDVRIGIHKTSGESALRPYLSLMGNGDVHLFTAENELEDLDTSSLVQEGSSLPIIGDEFAGLRALTNSALGELRRIVAI